MSVQSIITYLNVHNIPFTVRDHMPAFSAQEVAEKAHISGRRVAKTVVVKLDGQIALCVLPAVERVNLSLLRQVACSKTAELAREEEFAHHFSGFEPGAMPPFGGLFGMAVYLSDSLNQKNTLAFSSGSSSKLLEISWDDFNKLVHPILITGKQREAIG